MSFRRKEQPKKVDNVESIGIESYGDRYNVEVESESGEYEAENIDRIELESVENEIDGVIGRKQRGSPNKLRDSTSLDIEVEDVSCEVKSRQLERSSTYDTDSPPSEKILACR